MPALAGEIADPQQYNIDIKKRVARGRRETSSSAAATEVQVLRLDGVPVKVGRTYSIHSSSLSPASTVAGDYVALRVRGSTTGTATTSSTELLFAQMHINGNSGNETMSLHTTYNPASDATLSLLLTVDQISGSGNASISGTSTRPIELWIDDMGLDPGDTGVEL